MCITDYKELGKRIIIDNDKKIIKNIYFNNFFLEKIIKIFNLSQDSREFEINDANKLLIGEKIYNKYNLLVGNIINITGNKIKLDQIDNEINEYILVKEKHTKYCYNENNKYIPIYPFNSHCLRYFYTKENNIKENINPVNVYQIKDFNIVPLILTFGFGFIFGNYIYKYILLYKNYNKM